MGLRNLEAHLNIILSRRILSFLNAVWPGLPVSIPYLAIGVRI